MSCNRMSLFHTRHPPNPNDSPSDLYHRFNVHLIKIVLLKIVDWMKLKPHPPPPLSACARGSAQTNWSLHGRMKQPGTHGCDLMHTQEQKSSLMWYWSAVEMKQPPPTLAFHLPSYPPPSSYKLAFKFCHDSFVLKPPYKETNLCTRNAFCLVYTRIVDSLPSLPPYDTLTYIQHAHNATI